MASSIQLGYSDPQPKAAGLVTSSVIQREARAIRRTNDPLLAPQDERERSRSLIGKYYDILDNSYSSDYAGKRQRSEALSTLFSSLASDSRKANRLTHYKETTASRKPDYDPIEESPISKGLNDTPKKESKTLVYVPPKKVQRKTKDKVEVPEKKKPSNSIVLKRKVFENQRKVIETGTLTERSEKTMEIKVNKKQEPITSTLKVTPVSLENKPDPVEIIFCPVSGKQPLLKFIPESKKEPVVPLSHTSVSSKLASKRIEARNRVIAYDIDESERPTETTEIKKEVKQPSAKPANQNYQQVRPILEAKKAIGPSKDSVALKNKAPSSPTKKESVSNTSKPARQDYSNVKKMPEEIQVNDNRDASPEPTEVFKIVLPMKAIAQPSIQPKVNSRS